MFVGGIWLWGDVDAHVAVKLPHVPINTHILNGWQSSTGFCPLGADSKDSKSGKSLSMDTPTINDYPYNYGFTSRTHPELFLVKT